MSSTAPNSGSNQQPQTEIRYVQVPVKSGGGCFSTLAKAIGFVFIGLIAFGVLIGILGHDDKQHESSDAKTTVAPEPTASETKTPDPPEEYTARPPHEAKQAEPLLPAIKVYKIGDTIKVGYWTYKIIGVTWLPALGVTEYSYQRPEASFMLVRITVENNDKTPSTLPPHRLIDSQGRQYETSPHGYMLPENFGPLKRLNPDIPVEGYIVFDVPQGRDYKLGLSGGYASEEVAFVDFSPSQLELHQPIGRPLPGPSPFSSEQPNPYLPSQP